MSLETAAWISELDPTNPPGTDKKKQGDDHIRLLKDVLKACFPNADKAFYFPTAESKTANFSALASDMHKTFVINTAGGRVFATLPDVTTIEEGWFCSFVKINSDELPYFVRGFAGEAVNSGQFSVASARRCIPNMPIRALWTGSNWIVERAEKAPVGSVVDLGKRTVAPAGYAIAAGQDVGLAADFPELYLAQSNSTVIADRRGRFAAGRDNMSGVAANRISAGAGGTGAVTAMGQETTTLVQGNLPNYNLPVTDPGHNHGVNDPLHKHGGDDKAAETQGAPFGGDFLALKTQVQEDTGLAATGISLSPANSGISVNSGGSGVAISRLPPSITTELYVVLE